MDSKENALRAMQSCFQRMGDIHNFKDTDEDLDSIRSFDEDSIYLSCTRPNSFLDPGNSFSSHSPVIKMGWLDKTPPKGRIMFQKRWVTLDTEFLRYFQNEKEVFSKRFIAISTIIKVLVGGEQKFEVVTKDRTFLFRAESSVVRGEWVTAIEETIQQHCNSVAEQPASLSDSGRYNPIDSSLTKQGYLELNGLRSKLFVAVSANRVFLHKNSEEHTQRIGITSIDMNMGSVKSSDKCAFILTTLYKTFSFVAESKQQKDEWVDAMQACISRSLSSNKVIWKIWAEESNQRCADCGAADPDWASINLCVVICKCCAGVHRSLGQNVSKVRSLRMDEKVWTDNLIQVFLLLGNDRANLFWATIVPSSEAICPTSSSGERQIFIIAKYCQGKYRKYHALFGCAEDLNKALCKSVQTGDLLESLSLVFCGADVNYFTGDTYLPSPLSIAQHYGQNLQQEFLNHNLSTEFPVIAAGGPDVLHAALHLSLSGYLFKIGSSTRAVTERKQKGDFSQRWCILNEGVFRYYESEKSSTPSGEMKMSDVQCLVVNPTGKHGYAHTFELYHNAGKVYLFGAETPDTMQDWIKTMAKALVPPEAEDLVGWSFERVGRLSYTDGPNPHCPRLCWLALGGSKLLLLLYKSERTESIDLRKLQELCVQPEPGPLVLVERGRTLRIEGDRRPDFQGWVSGLQQGTGRGDGSLDQQQLTGGDVPVIVDRCLGFIIQHGLISHGIYRKAGMNSKVTDLLSLLCQDARRVQLKEEEHQVDTVANALKRFLRNVDGGVFNGEQASLPWLQTVAVSSKTVRISQYQGLLHSLPPVHRVTLEAVINHLYCVQSFTEKNQMNVHNLSIVFGPTLFQMDGTDKRAGQVVEDLLTNYQTIFNVEAELLMRQIDMISQIIKAKEDRPDEGLHSPRTICGIYLEEKEEDSEILVQVSQTMTAMEVVTEVMTRRNISPKQGDYWCCYLVNNKDDMERPLHYQEQVLPIYCSLDKDCHLVIKRNDYMKTMIRCSEYMVNISKNGLLQVCERSQRGKGRFNQRFCVITATNFAIYKNPKSNHFETEYPVLALKVYSGIRKNLQPPSRWGMTIVYMEDQQEINRWYLCCESNYEMTDWLATFMVLQHKGDIWPAN